MRASAPVIAMLTAAVLLALFVTDVATIGSIIGSRSWISRTQQAAALIDSVRAELLDAETGERDFFMTGRFEYRDAYEAATRALPATLAELRSLTSDDAVQVKNVDALASLVGEKLAELRATSDLHRRMEISRALDLVRSDDAATRLGWIRQLIAEMRAREEMRQQDRTLAARRNLNAALGIDVAALAGLLILGTILFAINRVPHPGEKRLIRYAETLCEKRPALMREQILALIGGILSSDVIAQANTVIDGLDDLLRAEGFDPEGT